MKLKTIIESIENGDYITEAAFSESKLRKVSDLLATVLGHSFGNFKFVKIEEFKKPRIGEGKGFLYMNNKGQMIRFGWLKKAKKAKYIINVIDWWDPTAGEVSFDTPTITILVDDWLNVVQVVDEIKSVLQKGVSATESLKESSAPGKKLLEYGKYKGFEWDGAMTAYKYIQALKERGLWDEEEYKGYKVIKGKKEQNSLESGIKDAEKKLKETKYADPRFVFDDIERLTKIVATGGLNALVISGAPGLGKSFHVEKTMQEVLGSPNGANAKWRLRKGAKVTPFGLYMDLFANRNDMTIVYDDSDSVLKDPDMVNMLKSAVDTYPVREISWPSRNTVNLELMDDEEREEYLSKLQDALMNKPEDVGTKIKLPNKFQFTSRIIFISNLPGEKFSKDPNLSAIKSRAFFIDVNLKREDVIFRIKSILPYIEPDVDIRMKEEIVDQLAESQGDLTMRAVVAAIAIRKAGLNDWERLVRLYSA